LQLAAVLKAVISQRLIPRADQHGRVPAVEVLVATAFIRDCIVDKEKTHLIQGAIAAARPVRDADVRPVDFRAVPAGPDLLRGGAALGFNIDEFKLKVQGISTTADTARDEMAKSVIGGGRRNGPRPHQIRRVAPGPVKKPRPPEDPDSDKAAYFSPSAGCPRASCPKGRCASAWTAADTRRRPWIRPSRN
jgi:twitching motility protein PilT